MLLDTSTPTATVRLAGGGHPLPMIVRADGTIEQIADALGLLVGIQPGAEFPERTIDLAPGDTLVAFTDGLLDAHAPTRILDADDVAAALHQTPRPAPDALIAELERRTVGDPHDAARDDVAILALSLDAAVAPTSDAVPAATTTRPPARVGTPDAEPATPSAAPCRAALAAKRATAPAAPTTRVWLPATPAAPALARARVRARPDLSPAAAYTAALLTSETVTNSVQHAELGPHDLIALTITADERRLRIEVTDHGPGFIAPRPGRSEHAVDDPPTRGRGLELVDALATRWGITTTTTTATVWLELER